MNTKLLDEKELRARVAAPFEGMTAFVTAANEFLTKQGRSLQLTDPTIAYSVMSGMTPAKTLLWLATAQEAFPHFSESLYKVTQNLDRMSRSDSVHHQDVVWTRFSIQSLVLLISFMKSATSNTVLLRADSGGHDTTINAPSPVFCSLSSIESDLRFIEDVFSALLLSAPE